MEMVELIGVLDWIDGLEWDPHVRGFLAVFAGFCVWMGSIWIIVSSNSGVRLGTLLSLAGLFAWLTIMGSIWWLYGIGWAGDAPIWEEVEIVEGTGAEGHLTFAALDEANLLRTDPPSRMRPSLRPPRRPRPSSAPTGGPWVRPVSAMMPSNASSRSRLPARNSASSSPSASRPTRSRACRSPRSTHSSPPSSAATRRRTWSELAAVAPGLIDQDNADLGGWTLLSTAEAGEAQASAIAMLLESDDFDFADQGQFKVLDAYTIGGKEGLPDDPSVLDRVWTKIRQTAQITHPTRYGVIQVRRSRRSR